MADGRLRSTALVLSRAYPQAVAGIPMSFGFSAPTGVFDLAYVPNHHVHAPTRGLRADRRSTIGTATAPARAARASLSRRGATSSRCGTTERAPVSRWGSRPGRCRPALRPTRA